MSITLNLCDVNPHTFFRIQSYDTLKVFGILELSTPI